MTNQKKIFASGKSGTIGKYLPKEVEYLELDLLSKVLENRFASDSDVIHLAGIVGNNAVNSDLDKSEKINVEGSVWLAESFLEQSSGVFYYISSSHVYSPSQSKITETHPLMPNNFYAEQKLRAEIELKTLFATIPSRLCVIRVFSVLDWDTSDETLGGGIRKLADKDAQYILNFADDIRDFLTPRRIAEVLYKVAINGQCPQVLNLCSGEGTTVGAAARKMLSESNIQILENRIRGGVSRNPIMVGDNSELVSIFPNLDLNWQPGKRNSSK
jgi:UDP-glucose 4-epimerase/GDP-4-dehydro-6-deoxy-D-mannose reductase